MPPRATWKSGSKPLERLVRTMASSRDDLQQSRELRRQAVQQYLGAHCFAGAADDRVPVNLIELEVNILTRLLIPERPHVLVTTRRRDLRPTAADFELAVNEMFIEVDFEQVVRRAVAEAWFGMGIVKHGLCGEEHELVQTGQLEVQRPFVDLVDLDDWVHDTRAREFGRIAFAGDLVPLDWEYVQDSKLYKETDGLAPDDQEEIGEKGEEPTRKSTRAETGDSRRLRDTLSCWHIYIPADRVTLVIPQRQSTRIIRRIDYVGPAQGPYEYLLFGEAPGAAMAFPPAASAMDLHELNNSLFRKAWRQADRQKKITLFEAGSEEDAERLRYAEDGSYQQVNDAARIEERTSGGADPQTIGMWLYAMNLHNRMRGNLDALGGLQTQSETARQDIMLKTSAAQRPRDMRARVLAFVRKVAGALAWYEWTEPLRERTLLKRIRGTQVAVPVLWAPETRRGHFIDFNFNICPYSLQSREPTEQFAVLMQFIQQILPLLPLAQAQGVSLDVAGLIRLGARYAGLSEIDEVLRVATAQAAASEPVKPDHTVREHVRVNRTGTAAGIEQLTAARELVGLGRSTGQTAGTGAA